MQLNAMTDYAIRMVVYLAEVRQTAGSAEICKATCIPRGVMGEVSKPLREEGILTTRRGSNGGYMLARAPDHISLADIVNMMEGTTRINRCLELDRYCSRNAARTCPVRCFYERMQSVLDEAFENMTIARLIGTPEADAETA